MLVSVEIFISIKISYILYIYIYIFIYFYIYVYLVTITVAGVTKSFIENEVCRRHRAQLSDPQKWVYGRPAS